MRIAKNYLHIFWRVPVLIIWMIVLPLVFILARTCKLPNHRSIPYLFHRGVRVILGLYAHPSGDLSEQQPTLYVSNHISYLDVFVLGDTPAFFVAKSEVANWPILGRFAKYQNTLFIERKAGKTKHALDVMKQHIADGNSLILFPEGTSTDGVHVEPFKSSLFEAVNIDLSQQQSKQIPIQSITVAYTHQGGKKMTQAMRDHYAWYANMPFSSHFFKLFALKKVDVKVYFHPVCYLNDFETRKHCADYCQKMIAAKLAEFNDELDQI